MSINSLFLTNSNTNKIAESVSFIIVYIFEKT